MRRFWASYKHFWQIHLTVALCTAVATGVLAGALLVGDSLRGSLRNLTLERLGTIQHALIADHFFQPELLNGENLVPAILISGTAVAPTTQTRATKVNIYGVADSFFSLWETEPTPNFNKPPDQPFNAIVINEALQNELNVAVGAQIVVNFPQAVDIHPEFLLGQREASEVIQELRLIVSDIIPTRNAGRFSLRPHQNVPLNAYIELPILQKAIGQAGKVNVLFTPDTTPISSDMLTLTLEALGLKILEQENHFDVQSRNYLLKPQLAKQAWEVAAENRIAAMPTLTYLANTITANDKTVPYSTIMALPIDKNEFGVTLATDEIILNTWTADELGVKIGDNIGITYYRVDAKEQYITETRQFRLKHRTPIQGIAADRDLIPEFPGIHDTTDIFDWNPPFPLDYTLIREQDETYWDDYAATPKAFIALETGRRLWRNRFGDITAIRIGIAPGSDIQKTRALFETELLKKIQPEQVGFQFVPLRADGLQASKGATDFGMLFGSLSGFIIIAVAVLVAMLFRIGVEQRSREIGILQAVGYPLAKIRRRFLYEGISIASLGSLLGCLFAFAYAQLMLVGLQTWWLPAIGTPFLEFHIHSRSLLIGVLVTLAVVTVSIWLMVRKLGKTSTAALLAGQSDFAESPQKFKIQRVNPLIGWAVYLCIGLLFGVIIGYYLQQDTRSALIPSLIISLLLLATVFIATYRRLGKRSIKSIFEAEPALPRPKRRNPHSLVVWKVGLGLIIGILVGFTGIGDSVFIKRLAMVLEHPIFKLLGTTVTILAIGWTVFDSWLDLQTVPHRLSRFRFAMKNTARHPSRSKTCVVTMSLACCIIVAVGANRHDAPPETAYTFVAESALPLYHSLETADGKFELGFSEEAAQLLSASEVVPFRVLPGEDVSCLNLYQPQTPQILGVSDAALKDEPWDVLQLETFRSNTIIGIGDAKSLQWILHHNPADDFVIQDEFGKPLNIALHTFENSLFQSQLIISESDFTQSFPSQSGYQYFLIKTPPELIAATEQTLEKTLSDYGFDVTLATTQLASYRAVENTYISTFQSLGGLGVLLGTIGLALVLFRNVIERRGELATLRAFGFRRKLLSRTLFIENSFLLTVGMLIGTVAGLVSIIVFQGHLPLFPWVSLTITLLSIFIFGIIANVIAVAVALRGPLLSTLKSE